MTVLRKSFYIHWSAGRSPRVHEVNPGRDPSIMAMSAALVRSDRDGKEKPVYFVSKMLTDAETRYTNFEQIVLALRMVVMKLRP